MSKKAIKKQFDREIDVAMAETEKILQTMSEEEGTRWLIEQIDAEFRRFGIPEE